MAIALKESDPTAVATLSLNELSQRLLLAVKKGENAMTFRDQLSETPYEELRRQLQDGDGSKLAFWINIYNSFYQILRKEFQLSSKEVYGSRTIPVAGKLWSLDYIEHGILRKWRYKHGFGYLPNLCTPGYVKRVAVGNIDFRVHFALNCGAMSCPRIAYYSPDKLDEQLGRATHTFLTQETEEVENEIRISKLFYWFHKDFGGKRGIKTILKDTLNLDANDKKLVYNAYSWEEYLDNYSF